MVLTAILVAALIYIVLMYVKDSRGVGPSGPSSSACSALACIVLLAGVFLLPAKQTWEEDARHGQDAGPPRCLAEPDESRLTTFPPARRVRSRTRDRTRLSAFLTNGQNKFLANLEAKNPVSAFRFASRLDENFLLFKDGRNWTRDEWEDSRATPTATSSCPKRSRWPAEYLQAWLKPGAKVDVPVEWGDAEKERSAKARRADQQARRGGLLQRHQSRQRGAVAGQPRAERASAGHRHLHGRPQHRRLAEDVRGHRGAAPRQRTFRSSSSASARNGRRSKSTSWTCACPNRCSPKTSSAPSSSCKARVWPRSRSRCFST